jgi:Ca-activated chloride channel family protein
MKNLLLISFLLLAHVLIAQTTFNIKSHDFGELEGYSDRFVDLIITNNGPKKEYVLSVKKPMEVVYIVNGQFMEKDSSITVRLQVNPKKKGKFKYEIEIYTSDKAEPRTIVLSGTLNEISQDNTSAFQNCPSFGQRPAGQDPTAFEMTVITIDKATREPLAKSTVTLLQNGKTVGAYKTKKDGKIKEKVPLGYSYFYAVHEGYYPTELGTYINFQRNYIVLELEQDKTIVVPIPEEPLLVDVPAEPVVEEPIVVEPIEISIVEEPVLVIEEEIILPEEAPVLLTQLDPEDFSDDNFKPVNITFVLDVSSSMNQADKIELMKFALYDMVDMLRPQDKISLVTYANDARVILSPLPGDNKTEANEKVEKLKASGRTAGGAGIKLGYKQNQKGFIENGINHVVVITDGAFNKNSDDYLRYVKRFKKNGINLSIVGVKNSDKDAIEMIEAAQKGGGRYVPIKKLADAKNNLRQEIRLISFRF